MFVKCSMLCLAAACALAGCESDRYDHDRDRADNRYRNDQDRSNQYQNQYDRDRSNDPYSGRSYEDSGNMNRDYSNRYGNSGRYDNDYSRRPNDYQNGQGNYSNSGRCDSQGRFIGTDNSRGRFEDDHGGYGQGPMTRDDHWAGEGDRSERWSAQPGTTINESELPSGVRTTMQKYAAGNNLSNYTKKTWNGKTVYESQVVMNGKTYKVCTDSDGELISMKRTDMMMTEHPGEQSR